MTYCHENLGQTDPVYGGVLTDISELPDGTTFYVRNGAWYGKILIIDGVKHVQSSSYAYDDPSNKSKRTPVPLWPAGSENNILALSDIKIPEKEEIAT